MLLPFADRIRGWERRVYSALDPLNLKYQYCLTGNIESGVRICNSEYHEALGGDISHQYQVHSWCFGSYTEEYFRRQGMEVSPRST